MEKRVLEIEEIRPLLAEVLAIDLEEVTGESRFFIELGGESIDWLEFVFLVKREFNLPLDEFNKRIRLTEAGELSVESLRFVQSFLPSFKVTGVTSSNMKQRIDELLDVAAIVRLIGVLEGERNGAVAE